MAVGDIFQFAAVGNGPQDQELVNRWYFRQGNSLVFDTPGEDIVSAFQDIVEEDYAFTFNAGAKIMGYEVRGITDPTYGYDFLYASGAQPVGSRGGAMLPPQDTCVIKWNTGVIGRSFRGRTYLWPAGEADQTAGSFETTYLTDVDAFVNAMLEMNTHSNPAFAHWELGVLSRWSNNVERPTPVFTPVIGGIARAIVHTQRRRVNTVGS